mmetsp:Transcript_3032/g.10789  ORF Transcript_3032/g.10789 Transcript_3032/m.10789 type:complete len:760 (+) Transcript_3032:64-2343(+)
MDVDDDGKRRTAQAYATATRRRSASVDASTTERVGTRRSQKTVAVADPVHVRQHVEEVLVRARGRVRGRGDGKHVRKKRMHVDEKDDTCRQEDVQKLLRTWEGREDDVHAAMVARFVKWMQIARRKDGWTADAAILAHAQGAWKREERTKWLNLWRKCACAASYGRATTCEDEVEKKWTWIKLEVGWTKAIQQVLLHVEVHAWTEEEALEACLAWMCVCAMDRPTCTPTREQDEQAYDPSETMPLETVRKKLTEWESRLACARTLSPVAHSNALELARRCPVNAGHEETIGCMATVAAASLWVPIPLKSLEAEARKALEQERPGLADEIVDVLQMGERPSHRLDLWKVEAFGGTNRLCSELARATTLTAKQALFQVMLSYCSTDTMQEIEPTLNTFYAARAASRAAQLGVKGSFNLLANSCESTTGRSLVASCERLALKAAALPPKLLEQACPELLHDLLFDDRPFERDTASKVFFHMLCRRVDQGKPALPSWKERASEGADEETSNLTLAEVIRVELDHAKEHRAWAAERFARVLVRVTLYVDLHKQNRSFLEDTPDEVLIVQAEAYLSGVNWLKACGAMNEGAAAVLCCGLLDTLCTWKKKDAVSGKHIGLSNAKALLNGSVFVYRTALDCFPIRLLCMLLEALPAGTGAGPLDPLRSAVLLMLMGRCSKVDTGAKSIGRLGLSTISKLLEDPDAQVGYYAAMYFLRRFVQQKPEEFNAALSRVTKLVEENGEDPEVLENPYNLMLRMKEMEINTTF